MTVSKYIRCLESDYLNHGLVPFLKEKFPFMIIFVYWIALGVFFFIVNIFPEAEKLAPVALLVFVGHPIYLIVSFIKKRKKFRKVMREFDSLKDKIAQYNKIEIINSKLDIRVRLISSDQTTEWDLSFKKLVHFNLGMNNYFALTSKEHFIIIPKSIFKVSEWDQITKPFWELQKKYRETFGTNMPTSNFWEKVSDNIHQIIAMNM